MNNQDRVLLAQQAARKAGEMLRNYKDLHVDVKAAHDFVTDADRASEKMIREILLSACPEDGFWGEEGGKAGSAQGYWVVDPIDGTTNFIKQLPCYTISIAYEKDGETQVGVVYAPALDEMYTAVRGGGAFLNGKPIHVSRGVALPEAVMATAFAHRNAGGPERMFAILGRVLPQISDLRRMGSAAYDLCCVACGRLEAYFEPYLNLYDIAAGALLVEEAGGRATGWPNGAGYKETGDILASNGETHEWLEGMLQ